jgi:hypothetical protein
MCDSPSHKLWRFRILIASRVSIVAKLSGGILSMTEKVKKAKAPAKPRKPAAKKEKVTHQAAYFKPSHDEIERLARSYWEQRGYQDGYAEQDWLRAEQELLKMAS